MQKPYRKRTDWKRILHKCFLLCEIRSKKNIRSAANAETAFAKEHPPKEVTLLRALSAFMDESGQAQLDRMTKGLMFLHTLQHVQRGVADFSEGNLLAARSAEGGAPEDLPSAQSARMAGLLLTLALAEQF